MTQRDDFGLHSGASPKGNEQGIEQDQYKVEHSGGRLTALEFKSNNSNADDVFRKDNHRIVVSGILGGLHHDHRLEKLAA
jgi:hypothetical protein